MPGEVDRGAGEEIVDAVVRLSRFPEVLPFAKLPFGMGLGTLVRTSADPDSVAGGPKMPHCSEAWDAISRYIYTGLQGGSIMKGWMNRENIMITCCNDGTRPVIFKIERIDYED